MSKKPQLTGRAQLCKLLREAAYGHSLYDVFRDFCEMSAISISNAVDLAQREAREAAYLNVVKKYDAERLALFPQMLSALVEALEVEPSDVLGKTFMELEIANKNMGQFFTPYEVCKVMADLTLDDSLADKVRERGFITVNEPASGAGATVIALTEAMKAKGFNPQTQMHVTAQDLDPRSAHMAYIQLSLLHIPAVVIIGNTLTMQFSSVWRTPAHVMGLWDWKLRSRPQDAQEQAVLASEELPPAPTPLLPPSGPLSQGELFLGATL